MEKYTHTTTVTSYFEKYDRTTDDFLRWIREVPLESDAVSNLPQCLERYENSKSNWKRFKEWITKL